MKVIVINNIMLFIKDEIHEITKRLNSGLISRVNIFVYSYYKDSPIAFIYINNNSNSYQLSSLIWNDIKYMKFRFSLHEYKNGLKYALIFDAHNNYEYEIKSNQFLERFGIGG